MCESQTLSLICEGTQYALPVFRGGFVLRFKTEHLSAHLQGDDARALAADYETIQRQFPAWSPDQTLAQFWGQGGYGWLAAQEAG